MESNAAERNNPVVLIMLDAPLDFNSLTQSLCGERPKGWYRAQNFGSTRNSPMTAGVCLNLSRSKQF
jgi:hypothetical protein